MVAETEITEAAKAKPTSKIKPVKGVAKGKQVTGSSVFMFNASRKPKGYFKRALQEGKTDKFAL